MNWGSKFHVMGEGVEHHLKEEEHTMFPLIKKVLSKQELIKIATAMSAMRERGLTPRRTPKSRTPSKMPPATKQRSSSPNQIYKSGKKKKT